MGYFNINIDKDLLKSKDLNAIEKWVYALIRAEERSGNEFYYSDAGLAEQLGIGSATASRAVRKLIELNLVKVKYSVDGYCFTNYDKAKANSFKFGSKIKRYLSTKNGNQNDARNGNQNDVRLKKEEAHNAASSWDESSYDPRVININDFWDD